ncbi:MAG: hypothetical protein ACI4LE_04880, partial [Faecalibacterium sp.]
LQRGRSPSARERAKGGRYLPSALKLSAKRECVLRLKSFFGSFFSKKEQKNKDTKSTNSPSKREK